MQGKNAADYVRLGSLLQFLAQMQVSAALHGKFGVIHGIDDLVTAISAAELPVSERSLWSLREMRKNFATLPEGTRLSEADCTELSRIVLSLRDTVQAEVQGIILLTPTPKRLDVLRLQLDPARLMSTGVFAQLPELTQYDVAESARCIAYERSTAGAFHILRATENSLRVLYCALVRRGRIRSLNWGPILSDLVKHPTVVRKIPDAPALFAQLDYIRQQFRNPTQHPDKVYDIEEVQDLWSLCIDVIARMARATPSKRVP